MIDVSACDYARFEFERLGNLSCLIALILGFM